MLRIVAQTSSSAAKRYYARADYYAAGADGVSVWGGTGATLLGLTGEVCRGPFHALCDNHDPRTGRPLTARTRTGRTVLYDWNFHVPKSLSVLIERTGDDRLTAAVRDAADGVMREVEAEALTRVRRAGREADRPTGNLVWAVIPHTTSRPAREDGRPDPHTHLHVTVFNATFDGHEGRWKAAQFRDLVRDAPYWQAQFHARLTASLAGLGYPVERTGAGWEVAGVPKSVVAKFSRRTAEVEALAAELGVTDPAAKAKLGATSRRAKGDDTPADLRAYWEGRLTPAERAALDRVAAAAADGAPVPAPVPDAAAARYAIGHCFATASVVPEKRLVAAALEVGVGGATAAGVRAELARQGAFTRDWDGRRVATTHAVLAEEQRALAFARDGRGTCRPLVPHAPIPDRLTAGQRAAVQHVLTSADRVMLVRGAAGTGKTTLTRTAVAAITAAGARVAMLAPSAAASRGVLRDEGFAAADTVARFLADPALRESARGGVVWVDEAGLLGAPTLGRLFAAAGDLDARVVLMGDGKQHGSVERGAALRVLETLAGLPVASVTEIKRQRGDYRWAVAALAAGRAEDGFARLEAMGAVHEIADDAERDRAVAAEYVTARGRGEGVLVVAPTHAEADRVTAAIRRGRRAAGQLGDSQRLPQLVPRHLTEAERADPVAYRPTDVLQFVRATPGHPAGSRLVVTDEAAPLPLAHPGRFQVYRSASLELAAGDPVRVTANGWTKDRAHRLNNGAVYDVAGFTPAGDVRLANGWVVARDFGHLAHGYVSTSHAAQGRTVDRVLVAQSAASLPASGAEQFYVSVSRGRTAVAVFTHDRDALRAAVGRPDPRLAAVELLAGTPRPAAGPRWPNLRRAAEVLTWRRVYDHGRRAAGSSGRDADQLQQLGAGA